MPRFFFHLYDDVISRDEEGVELPDEKAAYANAVTSAREMACAEVKEGHLTLHHRIEVEDERGNLVVTVPFADAVTVRA